MTREELLAIAKPILFNTEMVKAILEGRKKATRRLIKTDLPEFLGFGYDWVSKDKAVFGFSKYGHLEAFKPKYKFGDILYVRETFDEYTGGYCYKADWQGTPCTWKPSIHMPKGAARIFLKVTGVRVERLQKMNIDDIKKEGIYGNNEQTMLLHFIKLWDSTINKQDFKKYEWYANPYVFVYEFEEVQYGDI